MAKKLITDYPTGANDYAWSYYVTYSRAKFVEMHPLGTASVAETIGRAIVSILPVVGYIYTAVDALSALTSSEKTQLINNIYMKLAASSSPIGVQIATKYVGKYIDNAWRWFPSNECDVVYLYN